MADRYWVGGTGTWDGTNTANWSTSSGGASGASVPTAADNVFFDDASNVGTGAFTVTMATSTRVCLNITISGLDGAMTLAGTVGLTVSGSLSFPSTNLTITYTGTTTFNSTTTGRTIDTGGLTFQGAVTFNGAGGNWQLQGALTTLSSVTTTLTAGTLNLNDFTLTTGVFSSSGTATRSIAFGTTGSIVLTTTTAGATNLNMADATGFSHTGTSNISAAMSTTRTFNIAGTAGSSVFSARLNINLTSGASVPTFTGFFRLIDFTGSTCDPGAVTISSAGFVLASGGTYTSTTFSVGSIGGSATFNGKTISALTFNAGVTPSTLVLQDAGTVSGTTTLTAGTLDLNNLTLSTGIFSSDNNNNRSITFGSTGSIVLTTTTAGLTVLAMATANSFTFTGTSNFSTAMSVTRTFNFAGTTGSTAANRVNINLTSGASTPTFAGGSSYRQINFTGSTLTFASSVNCGGFTLASGGTYTSASFTVNSSGGTATFSGKTIQTFSINSSSASIILQDAGTVSGTTTLTSGTLDLNNLTLTTAIFSSNNTNVRSIAFGSTGSIVVNSGTAGATVVDLSDSSSFTFTGTSNFSAAMTTTRTFNAGNLGATAANRVSINLTSGASVPTFTGTFRQVNFTGSTCNPGAVTISCGGFTLASGGTYTSTTFSANSSGGTATFTGKTISALTIAASSATLLLQDAGTVSGTTTLTTGTLDLSNLTLTTATFSSSTIGARSIAFGTTGSIILNTATAGATNLTMNNANSFTFTGTSNISAAMNITRTFTFGGGLGGSGATAANRLNINLTSGASTPTFQGSFRQVNFTGSTCNPGSQTINCHGFTLASGGTYTSTNFTTFGDGTLTYTGKSVSTLNINESGITTTLADAGQNATTTLTNGTLDLAGFTLTSTTTATTATANTKNLTFNGGTLVCSAASATAWNNAQPTNFTTTAGTGTGTISMTAATAKTFVGGGSTYNCSLNQGGAGTLTITGANTFNNITNTNATASQITFPASTTTTVNNFTLSGTAGNLVSIRSSSAGTQFTLSDPSGLITANYLNIQDSNATGGAVWTAYLYNGNIDSGNNTGWLFESASGFMLFFN